MTIQADTAYPTAAFDDDVKRFLTLEETKRACEAEQSIIKQRIRDHLGQGKHLAPCGVTANVTAQRRFSSELATQVVPAEFLPLILTQTIDSRKAKAALPPALYQACQVEAGEPRVTIS